MRAVLIALVALAVAEPHSGDEDDVHRRQIWPTDPHRTAKSERHVHHLRSQVDPFYEGRREDEKPRPGKHARHKKKHKLGLKTLAGIDSIKCLKIKQLDPKANCHGEAALSDEEPRKNASRESGLPDVLNMGSYPSWRDPICHANGALLCDPEGLLNSTEQKEVAADLSNFQEQVLVKCGGAEAKVQGDPTLLHDRKFNFGVAIAEDWPSSETDSESLQKFGLMLMTQWGMLPLYNGVDSQNGVVTVANPDQYMTNCPNAAVLIILPKHGVSYLASPGCEFICQERGGDLVATAVTATLEAKGLEEAIFEGIKEVRSLLRVLESLGLEGKDGSHYTNRIKEHARKAAQSEELWVIGMRCVFVGVILLTLLVLYLTAELFVLAPWDTGHPLRHPTPEDDEKRSLAAQASKSRKRLWNSFVESVCGDTSPAERNAAVLGLVATFIVIVTSIGLVTLVITHPA